MSRGEVHQFIADLEEELRDLESRKEQTSPDRASNASVREHKLYALRERNRMRRQIETELHMRPALSLGCLCFVLIGCPVGIWASRSDYLSVFIICFMPTVFVYYPLLLAGLNMAKDGKLPPATAWLAEPLAYCRDDSDQALMSAARRRDAERLSQAWNAFAHLHFTAKFANFRERFCKPIRAGALQLAEQSVEAMRLLQADNPSVRGLHRCNSSGE